MSLKAVSRVATLLLALSGTSAMAADQINYQLGFLPSGCAAYLYLGTQSGMFSSENLSVTVLSGRGASDTLTKLATNVADVGEVTFDAYLGANAETAIPAKAVMALYTKAPDSLMTTSTSGISSLKDVVGKKIATPTFTSSNQVWPVILKQHGVDPASVTLIKADPNVLPSMLATNQVDGIIAWANNTAPINKALAASGKELKVLLWSESGYDGYSQTLVASNKMIKERPEVLKRFLKVASVALKKVYEDPGKAADSMKTMLPQMDLEVIKNQITDCKSFFFNEIAEKEGFGIFTPARVQASWKWVSAANNLPMDKLDPMTLIDGSFIAR